MSRREEEFKHRTSIFEGAYRAWSHIGGIEVNVLFDTNKSVKDLDPIKYPLINDTRLSNSKSGKGKNGNTATKNEDETNGNTPGTPKNTIEYPYEPLPRCGLTHPYVQAILSPWLGPNADQDAIELGLGTLRTWWQHRRKGENKSSIRILGTTKMRIIVDKYTKHFFDLAYCLVTNDYVQAPRTLHMKLKQSDTLKHHFITHRSSSMDGDGENPEDDDNNNNDEMSTSMHSNMSKLKQSQSSSIPPEELAHLSPLERMHVIQKNALLSQQADTTDNNSSRRGGSSGNKTIHIKGKCIPGHIDLPGIVAAVKRQVAHRGSSSGSVNNNDNDNSMDDGTLGESVPEVDYGDPNTTPLIFISSRKEYSIVLRVDGITCAHCVKIVETVLKGCIGANSINNNKSPINGLLDAAADHGVSSVIILIDHPSNAKRIAYESKRNLSLVGYVAEAITTPLTLLDNNENNSFNNNDGTSSSSALTKKQQQKHIQQSMYDFAKAFPIDFFDFHSPCTCPDSGVYRTNCPRHSQMDDSMFDQLNDYEQRINEYIKSKRGDDGEMNNNNMNNDRSAIVESPFLEASTTMSIEQQQQQQQNFDHAVALPSHYDNSNSVNYNHHDHVLHVEQPMQFFESTGGDDHDDDEENELIMNEALSLIDVDPLPYFNNPNHHHQPPPSLSVAELHEDPLLQPQPSHIGSKYPQQQQYPMYHPSNDHLDPSISTTARHWNNNTKIMNVNNNNTTNNQLRPNTTSALSIDWEVYELFNDFVAVDDHEANMMIQRGGPMEEYTVPPPPPQQQQQQQVPAVVQEQQQQHFPTLDGKEDVFQV